MRADEKPGHVQSREQAEQQTGTPCHREDIFIILL